MAQAKNQSLDLHDREYDVVVMGAAMAGVIAGALLQHRGFKVAIVEHLEQPGGRVGSTDYNGYWINWGHRDGHGYGDMGWIFNNGGAAARELGIEDRFDWKHYPDGKLRMHALPEGRVTNMPLADAFGEITTDPIAHYRKLVAFFGIEPRDDIAASLKEGLDKIKAITDEQAWSLIDVQMGPWLQRNVAVAEARHIILMMLENLCSSPGEHASLGRFALHSRGALNFTKSKVGIPDDKEVGGMAGVVMPWARRFKELGGQMWMGWKPLEITVEHRHVTGLIATNKSNLVQVFKAPVVITDYECWDLPKYLDNDLLPRDYIDLVNESAKYRSQVVSWWAGLHRMPTRRSDGKVEDHYSWQRLVHGTGAVKNYHGGWDFPSAFSSKQAPPGKHLMVLTLPAHGEYRWRNFAAAKHDLEVSLDYVRQYYTDLDECVEWAGFQFVPDQLMHYMKPVRQPPTKVQTVDGLYLASATVEGQGAWIDREAEAAINAANLATEEFGPYLRARRAKAG